jgi:hypothetical protein
LIRYPNSPSRDLVGRTGLEAMRRSIPRILRWRVSPIGGERPQHINGLPAWQKRNDAGNSRGQNIAPRLALGIATNYHEKSPDLGAGGPWGERSGPVLFGEEQAAR